MAAVVFYSVSEPLFWLWVYLQKEADLIYYSLPFKDPLIAVRPHESWNDWLSVSNHHALYQLPLYQLPFNYNYSSSPHVWLCKWTDGPRKPPIALLADLIQIRHCSISAHYTKVNLDISCPWRPTQLLASQYLMFAVPTCWIQYFFLNVKLALCMDFFKWLFIWQWQHEFITAWGTKYFWIFYN